VLRIWPTSVIALGAMLVVSCVPEGPPTEGEEGPVGEAYDDPLAGDVIAEELDPALVAPFEDRFERREIGPLWRALSSAWQIRDGALCVTGAKNRGVWLARRLPTDVVIEFDARAASEEGDVKVEVFGDGETGALGSSYDNAPGYVLIFGGWHNSRHVLARLGEHRDDRLERLVDRQSEDPRAAAVETDRTYRMRVERDRGRRLRWWVDGTLLFELDDPLPLLGVGHDHFGFNDWSAPVCFDNLRIAPRR
jgi:hypothetical protein